MSKIPELERLKIPLEDGKQATKNFFNDNFIGQGGFGKVYTGQLLHSITPGEPISTTVAVKRLDKNISGQGQNEFLMEIVMLASYKHENLVTLVGFSDESDEKIIVYEQEVRGSLDKYIASSDLTWEKRLLICLGAARGLNYLHSGVGVGRRVLHRDIKSSNILLNANWEAKISDFGLSKIGPRDQEFTFLVTHAAGTHGYADPQYLETGVFSKESDVYSFGVVLFEVLCGRLAMKSEYHDVRRFLYILVKHHFKQGRLDEIIMASLKEQMKPHALHTFSTIAYKCLNDDRKQRPTMRSVVQELQISLEFQMGRRNKTQLWGSSTGGDSWSWQFDSNQKLKRITIDHQDWIYSTTSVLYL